MVIIRARAPVRIGLGGGGTDISPYTEKFGGVSLNAAINRYAFASLSFNRDSKIRVHSDDYNHVVVLDNKKDLKYDGKADLIKAVVKRLHISNQGVDVYLRSDLPPRSGLGGSAAAFVAVIGLFNHLKKEDKLTDYEIAELAYELERNDLGVPGGRQDQYASVFGGLNFIEFKGGDFVRVNPMRLAKDLLLELEKNLVLVWAGERKKTDDILADQIKNVQDKTSLVNLHKTKKIAYQMKAALLRGDLNRLGYLMDESWQEKKGFSSMISNKYIDQLYDLAKKNGALGGKITGAGGGGHMLFYCQPNTEHKVRKALSEKGCVPVPFSFDFQGMQSWEVK